MSAKFYLLGFSRTDGKIYAFTDRQQRVLLLEDLQLAARAADWLQEQMPDETKLQLAAGLSCDGVCFSEVLSKDLPAILASKPRHCKSWEDLQKLLTNDILPTLQAMAQAQAIVALKTGEIKQSSAGNN
jgi:hypothetical protein